MAAPVPLRSDFDAEAWRGLARRSRDPAQTRRLLALSVIAAGGSRAEAAEIGGVGLQTVRDWVVAFNADGPRGLIDGKAPGARPRLNADQRDVLKALVEQGPTPAAHGVVRWRVPTPVLLLDQTGWHTTGTLPVPYNITLLSLPARSPELNPVENLWQFLRDNWLGNRIFPSYDDIIDHCCDAWTKLIAPPPRIMSIGLRQWTHEF